MAVTYIFRKNYAILTVVMSAMVLFLSQCNTEDSSKKPLETLRQIIAEREYYFDKKLKQIDSVQHRLQVDDPVARFDACRTLFGMYYDLQIDSALQYAEQMLELSETSLKAQPAYRAEALFLIARVYAYTGMYKESGELLDSAYFIPEVFSEDLHRLYFVARMELYKGLADQALGDSQMKAYIESIDACRDSLMIYTPENSVWHLIHLSNKKKGEGDYVSATEILYKAYNQLTTDDRDMAHVAFYMSSLYGLQGDAEQEKRYLITSAITDIKHAVKEYVALWKLATILYREKDVETAYQFIEISLQDAMYSGAYRWTQYIIRILPDIYASYNTKILQQKNTISTAFSIIACLLVCSVFLFIYIVRQYRKLDKAKSQLLLLNDELVSTNLLKETYLSKFIDLCSDYIDKLDAYRSNIKRLLKVGKLEKIEKELESTKYIEKEHRAFLKNFDETFLSLYPDFVSEFNDLFLEADRQKMKPNELLTTELRVFALIKLGITDSYKIAKFLRCSITTIYTYRSKNKNKSIYPESFEDRIKDGQRVSSCSSPMNLK
ncbi:DUF6377 domain-containing protein [Sphingobacterium sp. SGR-19]|uniref:DUF6377 domain-containing protein n=1 Tax=Sphingobacterium sp. SGR-19 TaxID=2710886 RepID=UPI0013EE0A3B|nr:DUF6377 domain-containing protein [Sphingobacterium sp. SGR-19]NGM64867.1 hypothetical protein [Sphingobacterium sp. SGR-19]